MSTDPGTGKSPAELHDRRALAVRLEARAFALVEALGHVRRMLLDARRPLPGAPAGADAVVRVVLGTAILGGLARRDLCVLFAGLRRADLDLDAGVLWLPAMRGAGDVLGAAATSQRFVLSTEARALWAWYRLTGPPARPEAAADTIPLLPDGWDAGLLQAAVRRVLRAIGLDSWRWVLRAIRIRQLITGDLPLFIGVTAGQLSPAMAPGGDWVAFGWTSRPPAPRVQEPERLAGDRSSAGAPASSEAAGRIRAVLRRLLRILRRVRSLDDGRHLTRDIRAVLGVLPPDPASTDPWVWVGRWSLDLLEHGRRPHAPRYRPNSVRTLLAQTMRALDVAPLSIGPGIPADVLAKEIGLALSACRTVDTRRTRRAALRRFLEFVSTSGIALPRLRWTHGSLAVGRQTRVAALLTPAEIRAVVAQCLQESEGLTLAVAVVLGGVGGLRRAEVCDLATHDVPRDRRGTVIIRRSKSASGRRHLALGVVAPDWALDLLREYARTRGAGDGAWLLTRSGLPWVPDILGERIAGVLARVTGRAISFHGLRRACATWLLVAWLDETIPGLVPPGLAADSVRPGGAQALLGCDPSRVLWSLARVLGHASPAVTLGHYMLGLDWIAHRRAESADPGRVAPEVGACLLGVSSRRARVLLGPARAGALLSNLLPVQLARIERRTPRVAVPAVPVE